ncbi:hypothetical protein TIFTF001_014257 [Ficus carica]|uniref:Uncharacterized protein n=1 Tax=Ficus carica TaxID=3494 RepID=A0AA88D3V1_FICCA|nr:hypothetical protein TIFTF001_014257 [Ficus carica]
MRVGKPQIRRARVLREPLRRGSLLGAHADVAAWLATLEGVTVLRPLGLAWWCDGWRLVSRRRREAVTVKFQWEV